MDTSKYLPVILSLLLLISMLGNLFLAFYTIKVAQETTIQAERITNQIQVSWSKS